MIRFPHNNVNGIRIPEIWVTIYLRLFHSSFTILQLSSQTLIKLEAYVYIWDDGCDRDPQTIKQPFSYGSTDVILHFS